MKNETHFEGATEPSRRLSRRDALRLALIAPAAAVVGRFVGEVPAAYAGAGDFTPVDYQVAGYSRVANPYPHKLPPLPYGYNALNRAIDSTTMRLHHGKHHNAYVTNLNKEIAQIPKLQDRTAQELIRNLSAVPEAQRTAVRNNAGGHVNHSMFWQIMSPNGGGAPTGPIAQVINSNFGSFGNFMTQFNEAGTKRFGSGWVWLVRARSNYRIMTTPNQDNPMMGEYGGLFPILGNDVWEHAYYLRYQNRRPDYLKAWWSVVDWNEINRRLAASG